MCKRWRITHKLLGSAFLKKWHFVIKERFNYLIYGVNTIIKCGAWHSVKFRLVTHSWNEMLFFSLNHCISELILPTLIQWYDKKSFHFWSSSKTRDKLKFYRLSDATFYDPVNTTYQFNKPFLDEKCLFLRTMEPLIKSPLGFIQFVTEKPQSDHSLIA